MPLPHHRVLFISYSHAWDAWSLQLYRAIFDTKLYFPFRDDRIPKTADWWQSLCLNIETSVAVVAMLTPEYIQSIYCMGELDYALELKKPVIPIMVNLPIADYPTALGKRNVQFIPADTAWSEQAMRENVLSAMNQILIDYASGHYPSADADFLPRDPARRPPVPAPNSAQPSKEDRAISKKIQTPAVHIARAEQDVMALIKQYFESKFADPFTAGNLLTQLSQQTGLPFFFNVDEERHELQIELDKVKLRLQKEAEQARLDKEYDDLEIVVTHQRTEKARAIVEKWLRQTGYPDRKNYLDRLNPLKQALQRVQNFAGKRNSDWQPVIVKLGEIDPQTPLPDMEMCLVPAGKFMMGANGDQAKYDDEKPAHAQTISKPYWIARYPVTNAQWRRAVGAGAVPTPKNTKWYEDPNTQDAPVVYVDWFMSQQFAQWAKCVLPSEMHWEYSTRGVESWMYPWGTAWEDGKHVIWKNNRQGEYPHAVTTMPEGASWVGAMHLIGNVWEWTSSEFKPYPYDASDGRERDTGDSTDVRRVLRGGSWYLPDNYARAVRRYSLNPFNHLYYYGVRVLRPVG